MKREEIIKLAMEADACHDNVQITPFLERFAALVADAEAKRIHDEGMVTVGHMREQIGAETKRADALAAVVAKLRDIVTSDAESKADFIARVRDVLGACPDQRVLHAVASEREACAKVADGYVGADPIAAAIRARKP